MAQRNNARIDRFAQMTKQEEIIAKKRQEILEKQRTAQLAKAVAAAQSLAAKMKSDVNGIEASEEISETSADTKKDDHLISTPITAELKPKEKPPSSDKSDSLVKSKKEEVADSAAKTLNCFTGKTGKISFGLKRLQSQVPVTEQPPPKVVNSFCNDGSFLENFKKILEKHEPKQTQFVSAPESNVDSTVPDQPPATLSTEAGAIESNRSIDSSVQQTQSQHQIGQTSVVSSQQQGILQPSIQQSLQHPIVGSMVQASMQQQHSMPLPPQQIMRSLQPPQQTQLQQLPNLQHHPQPSIQQQSPQTSLLHPPPPAQPPFLFNHPPQPPPVPPPRAMPGAFFAAAPPPPPPPQLPMALTLGPLYMIPAPEPMQLNTIPAPKEFDLNAIPNPQMNVEAIQMPHGIQQRHHQVLQEQQPQQSQQQQHDQMLQIHPHQQLQQLQQMQKPLNDETKPPPPPPQLPPQLQQLQSQLTPLLQHAQQFPSNNQQQPQHQPLPRQTSPPPPPPQQQKVEDQSSPTRKAVFSDNNDHSCSRVQLPTTVEHLIELVGENGDGYEDILRSHKNELHPTLWFLFEKNCEQYHNYRQQLNGHRRRIQLDQQVQRSHSQQQCKPPPHQQKQNQPPPRSEDQSPVEVDVDSSDSGGLKEHQQEALYRYHQKQRQQQQQHREQPSSQNVNQHDAADKYDPESAISGDVDSDDEYMRGMLDRNRDNIKRRIECRNELSEEERQEREAEAELEEQRLQERKKQRKSRWGEKVLASTSAGAPSDTLSNVPISFANQNKPILTAVTRNDPALLQYARLNYGSTNLSEEDWKKCEEHYKVNLLYQDMMRKRQEIDRLARNGKFKYEYDSDEDVDGGTWEHKLRCAEMEATKLWATALTKQSEGKHHIGDFLPPEELKKFMEQYEAKKSNRQPDLSDYKEYKLKEDNIGFQMLQKLGWKEGQGLGTDGGGIVDPVNKAPQRDGNQGLGVASAASPEECDNEYDAYRKRMMLAYRFRPNPLNNPRRAYY